MLLLTGGNLVWPRICSAAFSRVTIDSAFRLPSVIREKKNESLHKKFSVLITSQFGLTTASGSVSASNYTTPAAIQSPTESPPKQKSD